MFRNITLSLCLAAATLACGLRCEAAIYSRGKEVASDSKAVADLTRLSWSASPDAADKDRIQGHLIIDVDNVVKSVLLVFQSFDSQGKLITTFSISPKTCMDHPSIYWAKQGTPPSRDAANRFPLCGVENSRIEINPRNKHYDTYKSGEKAWFYVDSPRDKRALSIRLVNVVIDGKEVQYTIRGSANRLVRSTTSAPVIKHGTEAMLGSEYSCKRWAPTDAGTTAAPSATPASSWGSSTQRQGQGTWGQGQGSTWGQGQSTWPSQGQRQGQGTWGQGQGQSTWGQGQSTWSSQGQRQGNTWGQGQNSWSSQGQGQSQSTWGQNQSQGQSQFAMPSPTTVNVAPGAKVKLAAVEAGDIVVIQFMDGKCGRTVSGMMSPDDPESTVRPTLTFEQESPGQGRAKKGIDLLTGTKSAPQAVTAEGAGELFMELRATLMGNVAYRVWLISRKDSYSFYQTPVGKAVKSRPRQ